MYEDGVMWSFPDTAHPLELLWTLAFALAFGMGWWCEREAQRDAAVDAARCDGDAALREARQVQSGANLSRERWRLAKVGAGLVGGVVLCTAPNGPVSDIRNWQSWAFYACGIFMAAGFVRNSWHDLTARRTVAALLPAAGIREAAATVREEAVLVREDAAGTRETVLRVRETEARPDD
jgi:hypothetical protein